MFTLYKFRSKPAKKDIIIISECQILTCINTIILTVLICLFIIYGFQDGKTIPVLFAVISPAPKRVPGIKKGNFFFKEINEQILIKYIQSVGKMVLQL